MATGLGDNMASDKGGPTELDVDFVPGNDDESVVGDSVAVRQVGGVAMFWPSTFDRLDRETQDLAQLVMEWVGARRELGRNIDATAPTLRSRGMSWGQIGWLVGMSGEGARQRWGEDS